MRLLTLYNLDRQPVAQEASFGRTKSIARGIVSVRFLTLKEHSRLAIIGILIGTVVAYILHLLNAPVDSELVRKVVQDFMDQFSARA